VAWLTTRQMLFTWDTTDLCIVFRSWHVSGTFSLIVALIGIILLTAGYEAVREASRRYEAHANKALEGRRGGDDLRGKSPYFRICWALALCSAWDGCWKEACFLCFIYYHSLERRLSPARDKMCSPPPMNRAHCFTQGEMLEATRSSRRSLSRLRCTRCRCFIHSSSCKWFLKCGCDAGADGYRLLFMTYNGWIMLAVAVGAFVGYLLFANSSPTKSAACH
jgi:copper transporter 1